MTISFSMVLCGIAFWVFSGLTDHWSHTKRMKLQGKPSDFLYKSPWQLTVVIIVLLLNLFVVWMMRLYGLSQHPVQLLITLIFVLSTISLNVHMLTKMVQKNREVAQLVNEVKFVWEWGNKNGFSYGKALKGGLNPYDTELTRSVKGKTYYLHTQLRGQIWSYTLSCADWSVSQSSNLKPSQYLTTQRLRELVNTQKPHAIKQYKLLFEVLADECRLSFSEPSTDS